ncbi:hypothetical protein NC77_26725 [Janthinobacterium lividum]|nr:hypothetical protein NC77_26725 [Janthinobacterium lividum]
MPQYLRRLETAVQQGYMRIKLASDYFIAGKTMSFDNNMIVQLRLDAQHQCTFMGVADCIEVQAVAQASQADQGISSAFACCDKVTCR